MQGGMTKFAIFNQYLSITQKLYKILPRLEWNANRKPHANFRMVPFLITLTDPLPIFQGHDVI